MNLNPLRHRNEPLPPSLREIHREEPFRPGLFLLAILVSWAVILSIGYALYSWVMVNP